MSDVTHTAHVAILGGGSAAEQLAGRLAEEGRDVVLVEAHLVGGECPYTACVPSKAMLLTAERRHVIRTAHELGASAGPLDPGDGAAAFATAAARRDDRASHQDDEGHVEDLESKGVTVVRGRGRLDGPGRLVVDDGTAVIEADDIVIATGADVTMPPVDGLEDLDPWTFVEAWTTPERPASMVVLGAGAVGCEIAQVFARYGTEVTLVQRSTLLGDTVDPELSEDLARVLADDGVDVRQQTEATAVTPDGGLELDDGTTVTPERIVVATGKHPATTDIGLETVGIDPQELSIDDTCRVVGADGLWAIGDVTGLPMFTHTANYHGRIASENLLGRRAVADHRAVARTTYTSPQVAAVGMTVAQAEDAGIDVASVTFDLSDTSRGWVDPAETGRIVLVADRAAGVLVGAGIVAPQAGETIAELSLAIRAEIPLGVLADVIHPFPTWAEGLGVALGQLRDAAA